MSTNSYLWQLIINGPYKQIDDVGDPFPKAQWTTTEKTKWDRNHKVRYTLMCVLSQKEFEEVHACESAKEIWDTFCVTHKGTSKVKESQISMLV